MAKYRIEIYSRGLDVGIGTITKEQYEYWSDKNNSMYLDDALNDSYDYEDNATPENCKLYEYYNEYENVLYTFGPDLQMSSMTIKDEDDNLIYAGEITDFTEEHDPDYDIPMIDHGVQDYYTSVLEPGYYLQWCQGGKGLYVNDEFEDDAFDPKKLRFTVVETDFGEIVDVVEYDGQVFEKDGNYDIKSFEANVHHIE